MGWTRDARLSMGLVVLSLVALGAFLRIGFGPLRSTPILQPTEFSPGQKPKAGTRFYDVTAKVGLESFRHDSGGLQSIVEAIAPGLGLLDLDDDGDSDLVLLGGSGWETGVSIFLNRFAEEGELRFEDVTAEVGIRWRGSAQGVCGGDYDGDGDVDLFITAWGDNLLLANERFTPGGTNPGPLRFRDVTQHAGVLGGSYYLLAGNRGDPGRVVEGPVLFSSPENDEPPQDVPEFSTGATFGDFDLDGDLDLYVANYVSYHHELTPPQEGAGGEAALAEFDVENYPAQFDRIYANKGDGTFTELVRPPGLGMGPSRALGAAFLQLNFVSGQFDLFPDIYVANDGHVNTLLANTTAGPTGARGIEGEAPDSQQRSHPRHRPRRHRSGRRPGSGPQQRRR